MNEYLEGFRVIDVAKGPSTMTIADSGVSFSQSAVLTLEKAEYVRLLVNEDKKLVAVQRAEKDDDHAMKFFNPKRKVITVRWNYTELKGLISEMMNWDLQAHTYRAPGTYLHKNSALVFNFNHAKAIR